LQAPRRGGLCEEKDVRGAMEKEAPEKHNSKKGKKATVVTMTE